MKLISRFFNISMVVLLTLGASPLLARTQAASPTMGYTFMPASQTYTNVISNQTAQNYAATLVGWISAGGSTTCWLRSDGSLACWGYNVQGQATPPVGTFTQVSEGGNHACALQSDGTPVCWGLNRDGSTIPPAGAFTQISVGGSGVQTCGLRSDGTLACWGDNFYGQAAPPAGTFTQVSAGGNHTCGLRSDGTLACWGYNNYGQATPPAGIFTQVSAGYYHTCGLKSDSTLACWGDDFYGQATPPAGAFTQISAGDWHTCGLKSDGTLTCWGQNVNGQSTPPGGTFMQVSAGGAHTCGLQSSGVLTCWGYNNYGQSQPFSISGNVGAAGATLSYTDGTAKTAIADGIGNYSFAVSYNWSGTVTPSMNNGSGVIFSPASRSYTNVAANQTGQNYAATVTISGNAGAAGATLSYTDGTAKTATADASGYYSFAVSYSWSGTVTPSKSGVAFTPASLSYSNVAANQTAQNYAGILTYISVAAHDGWVLESSENSNVGGTINNTATTLRLGDDAANKQYRAILSFDTSSLPDNLVIQSATLKIKDAAPPSPWIGGFGNLLVDIRNGSFSGSAALQLGDFNAAASAGAVGIIDNIGSDGYEFALLNATGRGNVNEIGETQFRLRFGLDDNNNLVADYRSFWSGDSASGKPKLVITYTLP